MTLETNKILVGTFLSLVVHLEETSHPTSNPLDLISNLYFNLFASQAEYRMFPRREVEPPSKMESTLPFLQ